MLTAVSSSRVACMSSSLQGLPVLPVCAASHARLKSSFPVLFGGGAVNQGSDKVCASKSCLTLPVAAQRPCSS